IKQGKTEDEIEKIYGRWRSEKDAKQKKKVVSIDIHGNLLEPVPDQPEKKVVKSAPVVEEAPAEEAPAVEAAAEAAPEEAPAEEAAPEAKEEKAE
ncbi:MAG: hypothetical protein AAFP02_08415, partial [Bacteroidota bacterium]